ncbi:MAG TPA: DUF3035 domain-containing protein [Aliidongia sp.]|nr:DUF3035 domain-containing protein [Aliidongia sp.]
MIRKVLFGAAMMVALTGCSDLSKALGLVKSPPDEFTVVQGSPLTLPPDFELRPPRSASDKPITPTTTDKARQIVFRMADNGKAQAVKESSPDAVSPGEQALLDKAGAIDIDPAIRQTVDKETKAVNERTRSFVDKLMFWHDDTPPDESLNATAEAQRLDENAALNKPVTAGSSPQIERTKRTALEDLF